MNPVKIGIIGGTGYSGMELLRILAKHPFADVAVMTSRGEAGRRVAEVFPSLMNRCDIRFSEPSISELQRCDVVISAAPNGVAMTYAEVLLDAGVKVIDLSADFRLKDVAVWEQWYGMEHACPNQISNAVYGLPEINREAIKSARLIANPGCYPTAILLGYLPLVEKGLVDLDSLIADAKSGVSGAGRNASLGTAFSEVADSFKAYGASGHRHLPEICQGLSLLSGDSVNLVFTPHLLPINRGIHATLYARLNDVGAAMSIDQIQTVFETRYQNELFIDVLTSGSHPDTRSVRGSNRCKLAIHLPHNSKTIVVLSVEDNLVKGAAGQAIQNMNIMLGIDENTGLEDIALVP